ncbi:hypothetical protein J6590_023207 [Homalodisca vitripennis]|nr:hypothetical protein J6590_023207 [Homalodisca vitripennis]
MNGLTVGWSRRRGGEGCWYCRLSKLYEVGRHRPRRMIWLCNGAGGRLAGLASQSRRPSPNDFLSLMRLLLAYSQPSMYYQ